MKKTQENLKSLKWLGDSLEQLRTWPKSVTEEVGAELLAIQRGRDPSDWKPMTIVGPGAKELRISQDRNLYLVLFVAKFVEAIYVIYAFEKKTQKTSQRDLELAEKRYRELTKSRQEGDK